MKKIYYFLSMLYLLFFVECKEKKFICNELYIVDEKIIPILDEFQNNHDGSYFSYIANIEKTNDYYDIKLTTETKNGIDFFFYEHEYPFHGYINYKNKNIIFIFGTGAKDFFNKTNKKEVFDYISLNKENIILPIIFDPIYENYHLEITGGNYIYMGEKEGNLLK